MPPSSAAATQLAAAKNFLKAKIQRINSRRQVPRHNLFAYARVFILNLYRRSSRARQEGVITMAIMNETLGPYSLFLATAIFSFPTTLPLPYVPGLSTTFAIPLLLISYSVILNQNKTTLPKKIGNKAIKIKLIEAIIYKFSFILKFFSLITRPRLKVLTAKRLFPMYGVFMMISSMIIMMPLPGTNFLPSIAIFTLSIGLIISDGLLCAIAIAIGVAGVFLFIWLSNVFFRMIVNTRILTLEQVSIIGLLVSPLCIIVLGYILFKRRERKQSLLPPGHYIMYTRQ